MLKAKRYPSRLAISSLVVLYFYFPRTVQYVSEQQDKDQRFNRDHI